MTIWVRRHREVAPNFRGKSRLPRLDPPAEAETPDLRDQEQHLHLHLHLYVELEDLPEEEELEQDQPQFPVTLVTPISQFF